MRSSPVPSVGTRQAQQSKRSLHSFCERHARFPEHHHRLLLDALTRIEARTITRLMVFMPPGHAKSTYASIMSPAWTMGRNPHSSFVHCSHTDRFAWRFGRRVRNLLRRPESVEVFGDILSRHVKSQSEWETLEGGEYTAAGVGASIMGRRFDRGLIDDPVKGRKEADSPTYRDSQWDWYLGDFRSRQLPDATITLIQTRWHEDDMAGRILPADYDFRSGLVTARDGEEWYVLNFPAICERLDDGTGRQIGEPLWPNFFTLKKLLQEQRSQGPRNWAALYQQRPRPGEGGIFKSEWFKQTRYNLGMLPPECKTVVHSWDTAQKPDEITNANSCLTVWKFGRPIPGVFLHDVYAERIDYPELVRKVIAYAARDKPSAILIEDKSSGSSLIQTLRAETSLPVIPIEPEGDKVFRANETSWQAAAGLVHLPYSADWLIDYEGELFGFPLSTLADRIDSTTQFLKWFHASAGHIESAGTGTRLMVQVSGAPPVVATKGYGSVKRNVEE